MKTENKGGFFTFCCRGKKNKVFLKISLYLRLIFSGRHHFRNVFFRHESSSARRLTKNQQIIERLTDVDITWYSLYCGEMHTQMYSQFRSNPLTCKMTSFYSSFSSQHSPCCWGGGGSQPGTRETAGLVWPGCVTLATVWESFVAVAGCMGSEACECVCG